MSARVCLHLWLYMINKCNIRQLCTVGMSLCHICDWSRVHDFAVSTQQCDHMVIPSMVAHHFCGRSMTSTPQDVHKWSYPWCYSPGDLSPLKRVHGDNVRRKIVHQHYTFFPVYVELLYVSKPIDHHSGSESDNEKRHLIQHYKVEGTKKGKSPNKKVLHITRIH